MAKLILIAGPQAVGKMTVGQELTKITNLKLLHNHMTIELLLKIFDHSSNEFKTLENKPSKRNLEWSEKELLKSLDKYRLNSFPGEIKEKNYLRIDNMKLSAEEVAKRIKEKFDL